MASPTHQPTQNTKPNVAIRRRAAENKPENYTALKVMVLPKLECHMLFGPLIPKDRGMN